MVNDAMLLVNTILSCYVNLVRYFLQRCTKIICLLWAPIKYFIVQNAETDIDEEEEDDDECGLSHDDMEVVMGRLGMSGWKEGCKEWGLGEGVDVLLEEKRASIEELEEAFSVFDRNEDGFISPGELWCVMRRLGLQEGLKLEDCERMIRAFDEDGDGRVSFHEFTRLMENAF